MTSIHQSQFYDRTEEFRSICEDVGFDDDDNDTVTDFIQNAQHLVSQCESLEFGIRQFISVVDSLDLLLYNSGRPTDSDKQRETGFSYHELMREISQITSAIRQLEESIDSFTDDMGVAAFRRGVTAYLYARISAASQRFKQAEACRLERESKLKSLFSQSSPLFSCPPLKPVTVHTNSNTSNQHLPFPPSLASFLPPRWKLVLDDPVSALKGLDTVRCTTVEAEEGGTVASSHEDYKPVTEAKANSRRPPMMEKENERRKASFTSSSTTDEIPEDIRRDLVDETQHLLLEREVDTVDELHVRQVQRHLEELSIVDSFFATKVLEQQEICDNVVDLMEGSVATMADASKELSKAEERGSSYRTFLIAAYLIGALVLLIGDFLTSSKWY